jgi:hypothetical protein
LLRKSALYLNAHRFFVLGPTIFASVPNGARTWGLIASATGAGGIAGGLLVLRFHVSRPILAVQFAIALLATPLILLAIHSSTILLVLGSAMFGTDLAVVNILIQTSLQESIPNAVLSRVSSIYSLTTIGLGRSGLRFQVTLQRPLAAKTSLLWALVLMSVSVLLTSPSVRRFGSLR